jgi:phage-related tail protein
MKNEIEAIGKAISAGISGGFTDTSLHEIRRDLSYIFEQANKSVGKIDEVLGGVFGYANGTNNATRGLHIVGEAGPELVNFRGGEQVLNNRNTQKALASVDGGNTFNVVFNNTQDTTAYAMMSQLRQYNREMAINGVL